jgi:hypothetical protein
MSQAISVDAGRVSQALPPAYLDALRQLSTWVAGDRLRQSQGVADTAEYLGEGLRVLSLVSQVAGETIDGYDETISRLQVVGETAVPLTGEASGSRIQAVRALAFRRSRFAHTALDLGRMFDALQMRLYGSDVGVAGHC